MGMVSQIVLTSSILILISSSATAQVQCGFGAGSLRGQGYIIRDSPVPGTKGLVSGVGAPPYKLAASPSDRYTRVLMWKCNNGLGSPGYPLNAICLSLLHGFSPVGFVSRGPSTTTLATLEPLVGGYPTSAVDNRVWVCQDTLGDPGACISAYDNNVLMIPGRKLTLRECSNSTPSGLTNNYLTYAPFPFPAEPWLYYSDIAMFEREFTFKK